MSEVNPILAASAPSIEAYQQAIAQSSAAVVQWLQQPEMYQGKTVAELRERITLDFNQTARPRLNVRLNISSKTVWRCTIRSALRTCTVRARWCRRLKC